jgi:hypothetical protein
MRRFSAAAGSSIASLVVMSPSAAFFGPDKLLCMACKSHQGDVSTIDLYRRFVLTGNPEPLDYWPGVLLLEVAAVSAGAKSDPGSDALSISSASRS